MMLFESSAPTEGVTPVKTGGGNPKYSIITPVYNREDCIGRCIESVVANLKWCEALEHIVVDDGSTDYTAQIIESFADIYTHIKYIKFEQNRGTNAARNAAIAEARGDFCIVLDSDDCFAPNALQTIDNVVSKNSYRHYLFQADDLVSSHEKNFLLKGHQQRVVSFADFLSGCLNVGFIHVIKSETMKCHPFDEQLRIYEGVFFMIYFKEAQLLLYTAKVVTLRERGRQDSVSRDFLRTSKSVIQRTIRSRKLYLQWFLSDYERLGLQHVLRSHYSVLFDNYLLLSDYNEANHYLAELIKLGGKVGIIKLLTLQLRLGRLYRFTLRYYLMFKYDVLHKKLQ